MKLSLKDVTLCAADTANISLATRALHLSMEKCDFGDAVLFSHAPVDGSFRTVIIDRISSVADYSNFILKQLPLLTDTPYVLVIQWDGYVLNSDAWRPAYRDYDYIGARWPHFTDGLTVGNGGFSLRSRKLLQALKDPKFAHDPAINEDILICRVYRPALESEYGIRFAPEMAANRFSYENSIPNCPTFGFHGLGNMWRHTEDAKMIKLIDLFNPYMFRTGHFVQLIANYFYLRKFDPLAALYTRMRTHVGPDDALRLFKEHFENQQTASDVVDLCESLLPRSSTISSVNESTKIGS